MTPERMHQFQIALYETNEDELRKIAAQLGDQRYRQEGLRKYFLEKKLYRILGLMIDEDSFKVLMKANKAIDKLQSRLMSNGGWSTSRYGASDFTSEERFNEEEFVESDDGKRWYHVERDETGYHLDDATPKKGTFAYEARSAEKRFLKEKEPELSMLHQMYTIQERIMSGDYQVNPKHAELAELICEYFGFEKQPKEVPTKK